MSTIVVVLYSRQHFMQWPWMDWILQLWNKCIWKTHWISSSQPFNYEVWKAVSFKQHKNALCVHFTPQWLHVCADSGKIRTIPKWHNGYMYFRMICMTKITAWDWRLKIIVLIVNNNWYRKEVCWFVFIYVTFLTCHTFQLNMSEPCYLEGSNDTQLSKKP